MDNEAFDLVVVGGGSGGLACAQAAAGHGARTLLIEGAELGGTCVNRGCVPKKLLWKAAKTVQQTADMGRQGLVDTQAPYDLARHQHWASRKIASIRDSYRDRLTEAGVTLRRGWASIDAEGQVTLDGATIDARHVVLATGGQPIMLDMDGADLMVDSSDVLSWTARPERIVIVGAGYIGCEFASIFAALGSRVDIVNDTPDLLEGFDRDAVAVIDRVFRRRGVTCHMECEPRSLQRVDDGLRLTLDDGRSIEADAVICAVGRRPDLPSLGPIGERLHMADNGTVAVDEAFRTNVEGVHAIGDLADRLPLTPVAIRDGRTLARLLFAPDDGPDRLDLDHVATGAFTIPPLAQVGRVREGEASPPGCAIHAGHVSPIQNGVLMPDAQGEDANYHKLVVEAGRMVGAALVSDDAADTIAGLAAMVSLGSHHAGLCRPAPIHPTFAEEFFGED